MAATKPDGPKGNIAYQYPKDEVRDDMRPVWLALGDPLRGVIRAQDGELQVVSHAAHVPSSVRVIASPRLRAMIEDSLSADAVEACKLYPNAVADLVGCALPMPAPKGAKGKK